MRYLSLCLIALGFLALTAPSQPAASAASAPVCGNAALARTAGYEYVIGGADYSDADGDLESGSSYRWLVNGAPLAAAAPVREGLLLNFENAPNGANGETPTQAQGLAYAGGKFGQALALSANGSLRFARADNLYLNEGTLELWVAPRANGSDAIYSSRWHVFLAYQAANGDSLYLAQDDSTGVVYAGGNVGGQWQSAYSSGANSRTWAAGEWHHLALTYSATGNFMRFYLDGVLAADTNEGRYVAPASTGATFSIGGPVSGEAAHYWIEAVRLSGRVSEPAEIAARARRSDAPRANEVWLPATALTAGQTIAFEFTPGSIAGGGSACTTASWTYPGLPILNPQPPSTLLAPGTTSVDLTVTSLADTQCAWSVGQPLPYAQMTPFNQGAGTKTHRTLVSGLSAAVTTVNAVYVSCASQPDFVLALQYRSRGDVNPSFPRTGNLWGWWQFLNKDAAYIARTDLWLGADFPPALVKQLRAANPNILILTSINAVENSGLPSDYYLKDVNGNRIEVWPGSYRLNLTKPYVAEYQARYAYQRMLDNGLLLDGVFFDNVMTTQSWQNTDIYGNPRPIDANEDGLADDPAALDAAWKAGVFHEMQTFRQLMPHAIVTGHSMNIYEADISDLFNGISLGFWPANVIEREQSFDDVFDAYNAWLARAQTPRITMFEASPIDQIAYGYSYEPQNVIPPSTLEFARTYYPWMRFGLGLTLLNDGYFAYEFGDTWHGNDWWYDELDFDLGYPQGAATRVEVGFNVGPNQIVNPGFESALAPPWESWSDTGSGYAATLTRDTATAAEGSASARINITQAGGTDWRIGFWQANRSLQAGASYRLQFWAKADRARNIGLNSQKGAPNWDNYGLGRTVAIDTQWREYTVTFVATATANDARLQFLLGETTGTVWLDHVRLTLAPPDVYQREYTHGLALVNGTAQPQTVNVGAGWRRLTGAQAPKFETILDDQGAAFTTPSGSWSNVTLNTEEWLATGPFYHAWNGTAHKGTGGARWTLPISATDTYTVTVWWPAAPEASTWNTAAKFDVVANGSVVASATFNQRLGGDEWHTLGAAQLSPDANAYVRVTCSGAPCIADALHLRSAARYNDGSVATTVTLQPFDAIVMRRDNVVLNNRVYLPVVRR